MSFMREKYSRQFFLCIIIFSTFLFAFGGWFCTEQIQTAKEMIISHDQTVAGSLLKQGISPEKIACAIANTEKSIQGNQLLLKIGYTEETTANFLPEVSVFKNSTIFYLIIYLLTFIGVLIILCLNFLIKRERLYHHALKIICQYTEGNFTTRLSRTDEGTIYQLFTSVNDLATTLKAKGEIEYNTKEFLKDTISDIFHQLKTPLAALDMYNEIISDEPDHPDTVIEFSRKTTVALGRIEQLIQSLLKITRLDAGSVIFEKRLCTISDIVSQSTQELITRASQEKKQIVISGEPEEQIICDLQWTSEAIGNLVKNALDHTGSSGQIQISWGHTPMMLRIYITDNGTGIAPEDIHHIFKRFYRSRHSLDTQGVGLGLPLAKSIIEGQGGILSVQSTPNIGTTFIISFLTEL